MIHAFLPKAPTQSGDVKGKYYTRHGACNQCGKCCTNIYLIYGDDTITSEAQFEKIKRKDPEYRHFKPVHETEHGLQFQCIHLTAENQCSIYEDRPTFCKSYPTEKGILMGGELSTGCGYSFTVNRPFQSVLADVATQKRLKPGKLLSQ